MAILARDIANFPPVRFVGEGIGFIAEGLVELGRDKTFGEKATEVFKLRREIEQLEAKLKSIDTGPVARRNSGIARDTRARLAEAKEEVKLLEDEVKAEFERRRAEVKLRIDNQDLINQIAETEALFTGLKDKVETDIGVFKIPGVDDATIQAGLGQLTEAFFKIETKAVGAEEGVRLVNEALNKLAEPARLSNIATTIKQINELDAGSQGYNKTLAELTDTLEKQTASLQLDATQRERIQKILQEARKQAKKSSDELKKDADKRKRIQDKELRDAKNFTRKLNQAFDVAIPPEISEQLADLFNTENLNTQDFIDRILEIRKQFVEAGGDVAAFQKEIFDLKELAEQKIEIKGTAKQTKEDVKRSEEAADKISQANSEILGLIQDIGNIVRSVMSTAIKAALGDIEREDFAEVATSLGTVVGGILGGATGGAAGVAIGASLGQQIGAIIGDIGQVFLGRNFRDLVGTQQRKQIDKAFGELINGDRLAIVFKDNLIDAIDEATGEFIREAGPSFKRISDFVFEGFTAFGGPVDYGSEEFFAFIRSLPAEAQNAFNAFGTAFGELLGVSAEQARMIGAAITNNIGGSLQNLQILIQTTGKSFEELSQALLDLFLDAKLSIEEYYVQAIALKQLFEVGIPGAIGAVDEALENLQNSLADGKPGRYAVDSLRDVAAEGQEVSRSFEDVVNALAQSYGVTAQQAQLFFVALQSAGVNSLEALAQASDNLIATLLFRFEQIKNEAVTTAEEVQGIGVLEDIQPPQISSGGSRGPDPAKERADALKRLRDETYRLLIASQNYANILFKINNLELTNLKGGREIRKLREDIFKTLRRVNNLEEKYQEELNKGARASEKRLSRLGRALDEARKKLDELTEAADQTNDKSRQLDLAGIIPLIKSVNSLGVVTRQAGVDLEKNIDILLKGFLQGRLSISEVNAEIEKTKELLGPGIPNAVGAVTDAFQNLIDAGEEGGAFSVDAFTDIFAEFREKFEKEGSALREAQRQQLVANLEAAKQAFAQAVGPEATEEARKSLDLAKKALSDFYDEIPAPNLEDLRSALQAAFSPEQVDLFFRALDESGLKTFDDFEKAGADSVVGILGRLKELGFEFGETSQEIKDINSGLQDAEKSANGGLDPLAQAIELVKQFNEGASTLPPVFNSTTDALDGMNEPLQQLADGFDSIIEKLSLLSGQTFENDVVFNVRTVGDSNSQTLVDILFGDGSGVGDDVGGDGPGVGGDGSTQSKLAKFRRELAKLKSSGRGRSRRAQILRQRIRRLTGRGGNN